MLTEPLSDRSVSINYFKARQRHKDERLLTSKNLLSRTAAQIASTSSNRQEKLWNEEGFNRKILGNYLKNQVNDGTDPNFLETFFLNELFDDWKLLLNIGSSLALYGYGSKSLLLNLFSSSALGDGHVFHVKTTTESSILKAIDAVEQIESGLVYFIIEDVCQLSCLKTTKLLWNRLLSIIQSSSIIGPNHIDSSPHRNTVLDDGNIDNSNFDLNCSSKSKKINVNKLSTNDSKSNRTHKAALDLGKINLNTSEPTHHSNPIKRRNTRLYSKISSDINRSFDNDLVSENICRNESNANKTIKNMSISRNEVLTSSNRSVRLILTFEHVNCLALSVPWDEIPLVWLDATTFRRYNHLDLGYMTASIPSSNGLSQFYSSGDGEEHLLNRAVVTLNNLSKSSRLVFRSLIDKISTDKSFIPYADWLHCCINNWHVSSEQVFRLTLAEFIDHDLVTKSEDVEDVRMNSFGIPFSMEGIKKLLSTISC